MKKPGKPRWGDSSSVERLPHGSSAPPPSPIFLSRPGSATRTRPLATRLGLADADCCAWSLLLQARMGGGRRAHVWPHKLDADSPIHLHARCRLTPASHAVTCDHLGLADAGRRARTLLLQAHMPWRMPLLLTGKPDLQSRCTATLPAVDALPRGCVRSLSPSRRRCRNKRASTSPTPR